MKVIIDIDAHKASHTAVAIDEREDELASLRVRATRRQLDQLVEWARPFEKRTWAIESAGGLGYLLGQQLVVAAGEEVLDVPVTLASRVRVLATGHSNKKDPNDARSVAIAALRAPVLNAVVPADHAQVLRMLAKRNVEIGVNRRRTVARLHAILQALSPGGISKELHVSDAERLLGTLRLVTPVEHTRVAMATQLVDDVRRLDFQLKASHRRIKEAVKASGTTLTDLYGVGPVLAAMLIGYTGDVRWFANRDHFASYCGWSPRCPPSGVGRILRA